MIKCIAIDDEKKALDVIVHYAKEIEYLNLCKVFNNPLDAIQYLESHSIDLLFLDINMPGLNGFEFLQAIHNAPKVIFTTAYSRYAVESYNFNALDYLVKPITFPRFLKAISKYNNSKNVKREGQIDNEEKIILLKSGTETHRIDKKDILYIKSEGNYAKFVFAHKSIMSLISMKKCLEMLNDPNYLQIHRSFIVSIPKVQKIENHQVTINEIKLPIGVSFRKSVIKTLVK